MPGKKQGQGKMQEEAELSVQMTTSELETLVNLQAAFEKIEPGTSEVDVSYEQAQDEMIVEEVHDSADPLLRGVVLGSSAEGELITGDVEEEQEDTVTVEAEEEQEDQPTYLFVQHTEGQSGDGGITEARTADGSIVQLRQITSSGTIQGLQGLKPLQPSGVKRQAQSSNQQVTKVIISGNNSSSPQMVLTSSPSTSQTVRLVTTSSAGTSGTTSLPSNSRTITLAQAQQMGLIASPKVQIASSPQSKQNLIINKISSPTKMSSPRITMVQQGVKSPTKILPAPGGAGSLRPAVASVAQMNTPGSNVKQLVAGPQKIIIRQAGSSFQTALKPGTVLTGSPGSGSQIIRIPATQNIVSGVGENQAVQIQQGRQIPVQYLRLVSSPQSSSSSPTKTTMVKQQIAPAPVKMVPIAPATSGSTGIRSVAPKTQGSIMTQKIMIPTASSSNTPQQVRQVSQMTPVGSVTPAAVTQLGGTLVPTAGGNFMVLPAQIYDQLQATPRTPITPITPISPAPAPEVKMKEKTTPRLVDTTPRSANRVSLDTNGIRPRKPCNCTKSQCLKLYCDCFANGEFCNNCNCNTCYNNLEHEEERQKAIRACLERNPQAFKPKIGKTQVGDERRHNKGCNCRRSGCLKNYCECYEAKIPCTHMCKCIGCRNLEDSEERRLDRENVVLAAGLRARQQHLYAANRSRMASGKRGRGAASAASHGLVRQPFGFMNQRLVEATCECLLAQAKQGEDAREEGEAEEGEGAGPDETEIERRVLEEYGACLKQFIECSTKQDV